MNNLGKALVELGELAEARPLLERATAGQAEITDAKNPFTTRFATNLLEVLLRQGSTAEAQGIFERYLQWLIAADPATLDVGQRDALTRLTKTLGR